MDRKLRPRATLRALPLAGASRWLGPLLHAARLQVRPTRPTLEPSYLIAQSRHHSLQLDDLLPLLDNQASAQCATGHQDRRAAPGPQRIRLAPHWESYNHTDATDFAPLTSQWPKDLAMLSFCVATTGSAGPAGKTI